MTATAFRLAVIGLVSVGLASCSTARRLWPFGGDGQPEAVAAAGERVSIIEFEQQLTPSSDLAGRDFFLPGPTSVSSWAVPGGNLEQSVEHVNAAPAFQVGWRRDIGAGTGGRLQVTSPPVADNGRLFAIDGEADVVAVDAATGAIAWRTNIKPTDEREPGAGLFGTGIGFRGSAGEVTGGFGGGVAAAGGRLFVVSGYRQVLALDAATGAIQWRQSVESPIHGAPTVAGNRLYAIDVDNQLLAFDVATGEQAWSYQAIAEPARFLRASSPAVTGDTIIAPFSSGEVIAVRAANGQPLWQQVLSQASRTNALSEIRDIAGRPVINRQTVYAVSHSGVMSALDLRTGQPKWSLPVAGVNAPLAAGDAVYIVSKSGELTVANRENGGVYWTRDLNEGRVRQEGGFLGFFDRTVRPIWSGPILASNRLILVNSDGVAVALDPKTGAQQSEIRLGAPAYIAPMAYNGVLYVLLDNGQLVSIQ